MNTEEYLAMTLEDAPIGEVVSRDWGDDESYEVRIVIPKPQPWKTILEPGQQVKIAQHHER